MRRRFTILRLAAGLACVLSISCGREVSISVELPDEAFDLAIVALVGESLVLDHTELIRVADAAQLRAADIERRTELRLAAFLYESTALGADLSVEPTELTARIDVSVAPAGELPLPEREPGGDRVSVPFTLDADDVLGLPEAVLGSSEASFADLVAVQLMLTIGPLPTDSGTDAGPVADSGPSGTDAGSDSGTDSGPVDGGIAALGPFSTPVMVSTMAPSGTSEDDPSFTEDLLELYFASNRPGGPGGNDIWLSTRALSSDPWGTTTVVPEVSSIADESYPRVSPDGLTMYFTSNRVGGIGLRDIWVSIRASRAAAWGTPAAVTELNSSSDEKAAGATPDGLSLVLTSDRDGSMQYYVSVRASTWAPWGTPLLMPELSSTASENAAQMSPGGFHIFFDSDRSGGLGNRDIWLASRLDPSDPFGPAVNVTELNSAMTDSDPWLSPDLRYIVFTSYRSGAFRLWEAWR